MYECCDPGCSARPQPTSNSPVSASRGSSSPKGERSSEDSGGLHRNNMLCAVPRCSSPSEGWSKGHTRWQPRTRVERVEASSAQLLLAIEAKIGNQRQGTRSCSVKYAHCVHCFQDNIGEDPVRSIGIPPRCCQGPSPCRHAGHRAQRCGQRHQVDFHRALLSLICFEARRDHFTITSQLQRY